MAIHELKLTPLPRVSDAWLDHVIERRAIALHTLGVDAEILSALVELRDRRRAEQGGKDG